METSAGQRGARAHAHTAGPAGVRVCPCACAWPSAAVPTCLGPVPHLPWRRFLPACCAYTSIALTAALAVQLGPGVLAQRGVSEAAIGASALACSVGGRLALAGYASAHRCAMRASEGLPPAPCSDFWLWCCCPLCANCQEGAQMEVRRGHPAGRASESADLRGSLSMACRAPDSAAPHSPPAPQVRREAHLRQAGIKAAMVPPAEQRMQYK